MRKRRTKGKKKSSIVNPPLGHATVSLNGFQQQQREQREAEVYPNYDLCPHLRVSMGMPCTKSEQGEVSSTGTNVGGTDMRSSERNRRSSGTCSN
ncbi:uncharacterized protein DMAD_06676 [Drosophila madeirensis]|uniref:Uncharacterized protein n=1 Tax=Drosophila madeirensis TaxID=30013 RepID=A0AAU9FRX6_DROMD